MMHVVQQGKVSSQFKAQLLEQAWDKVQVALGRAQALAGQTSRCGLVRLAGLWNAVSAGHARDAALCTYGEIALLHVAADRIKGFLDVAAIGVRIDQHTFTALSSEQVVNRSVERLALDVPQGYVYCSDGAHRHGSSPPVRAAIEILPYVFDVEWVASDQAWKHMLAEITGDGEFAAIECSVAQTVYACVGFDLQCDEVAVRRADDQTCSGDLHKASIVTAGC